MSAMARASSLDVLLTLVDHPAADGMVVSQRLADAGKRTGAARLLAQLLELDASGHVAVARDGGYSFSLTPLGVEAAAELAPGRAAALTLVMIDLVGFVSYTASCGDDAARQAAELVASVTASALEPSGGRVVKSLGDGVLGCLPVDADALGVVARIAQRLAQPDAGGWQVRAAAHAGAPIELRGDVYGHDVNLVARLCELAQPNEVVCSAPGTAGAELVAVRGLVDPVAVVRQPLLGGAP
jgi:class 3 adenylate cyclase